MLYQKIRPSKFSEMIGNLETLKSLKKIVKSSDKPHTFLFTGERGTGKTTAARILTNELGCSNIDLEELNGSDNRGIDDARRCIEIAHISPLGGKCRVIIWDECFYSQTKILTTNGEKEIQFLKKGDLLFNLKGIAKVKNIFKNKVDLNRIIRLNFSDDSYLFCTKEHLFLTDLGWKKAIELKKDLFLSKNYHILSDNKVQKKGENHVKWWCTILSESLYNLWKKLYSKITKSIKMSKLYISYCKMQTMWERIHSKNSILSGAFNIVLLPKLCWKMEECPTRNQEENVYRTKKIELQKEQKEIYKGTSQRVHGFLQNAFGEDEKKQSNEQKRNCGKNDVNQKIKWNFKYMAWRTWRKWKVYISTIITCLKFRMENGSSCINSKKTRWFSDLLQIRYWKFNFENRNRNRWKGTQIEKEYFDRYKKGRNVKKIRLESITIYKRGCNEESFRSVIENKERNQGYVELYDLEISNHPSYFANGLLVHNCHKMTNEAQNALLKVLEDTPKSTYFILCSTDPDKLLKTVKSRCTNYRFNLLNENEMIDLLVNTITNLEREIDGSIIVNIVDCAMGSPRDALVLLEQVLLLDSCDEQLKLLKKTQIEYETIELCRMIMKGVSWKSLVEIYKGIVDPDAEMIRRSILGYFKNVLLKTDGRLDGNTMDRISNILNIFSKSTFDSGEAQLINMLYQTTIL